MRTWNFVWAALFVFVAVALLTAAVDVASDYKHAQILVAPDFGQLADQAFDEWRSSFTRFFEILSF